MLIAWEKRDLDVRCFLQRKYTVSPFSAREEMLTLIENVVTHFPLYATVIV